MKSLDNMLSLLDLFDEEHSSCTIEQAQAMLGNVHSATVYRYFQSLAKAGLVANGPGRGYILGPRIIELERNVQQSDGLLAAGRRYMPRLEGLPPGVALLSVSYGKKVLCIHSLQFGEANVPTSFVRGRPLPFFRSATSKIILAHLQPHQLKALYAAQSAEVAEAGLGQDWEAFKDSLKRIRRQGFVVAHSELDPGLKGIAVPVLSEGSPKRILASLSYVVNEKDVDASEDSNIIATLQSVAQLIREELGRAGNELGDSPKN